MTPRESDRDWKTRVHRRYEALKRLGRPFFPDIIFKDTVAVFLLFLGLVLTAAWVGAELEPMADPTDTHYNPRPEWYFLFLFQALKFFPGSLEAVAAIILPSLVLVGMLLLPWLDRGPRRHPRDRLLLTSLGLIACAGFAWLTITGARSPLLNPVVEQDPQVIAGKRLYDELRCAYCHRLAGRGGTSGPDLTDIGARRDRAWLLEHFAEPSRVSPGSLMPKLNLLLIEAEQLAAFLQTLGGAGPFTAEAPRHFVEQCQGCHRLDGAGGEIGPDLSAIRTYRDRTYLIRYIADPTASNQDTAMPAYQEILTPAEIEDLARYLLSTKR